LGGYLIEELVVDELDWFHMVMVCDGGVRGSNSPVRVMTAAIDDAVNN
jgi:hypothetical protein